MARVKTKGAVRPPSARSEEEIAPAPPSAAESDRAHVWVLVMLALPIVIALAFGLSRNVP